MFLGNMMVVVLVFSSQFPSSFTILLQQSIHSAFHVPGSDKKEGKGGRTGQEGKKEGKERGGEGRKEKKGREEHK